MRFNGICIVTQNVARLCAFYREILRLEPEEGDVFKIIPTEGAVLSIFSSAPKYTTVKWVHIVGRV